MEHRGKPCRKRKYKRIFCKINDIRGGKSRPFNFAPKLFSGSLCLRESEKAIYPADFIKKYPSELRCNSPPLFRGGIAHLFLLYFSDGLKGGVFVCCIILLKNSAKNQCKYLDCSAFCDKINQNAKKAKSNDALSRRRCVIFEEKHKNSCQNYTVFTPKDMAFFVCI